MVLIEAMACGTPVLSLARGAVPEVVVDGVTGFVRREPDELVEALDSLDQIDPRACRKHVEEQLRPGPMVSGYEQVYRDCLRDAAAPTLPGGSARDLTERTDVPRSRGLMRRGTGHTGSNDWMVVRRRAGRTGHRWCHLGRGIVVLRLRPERGHARRQPAGCLLPRHADHQPVAGDPGRGTRRDVGGAHPGTLAGHLRGPRSPTSGPGREHAAPPSRPLRRSRHA